MRTLAALIAVLTLGCTTAEAPSGAKLRATGKSNASLMVGEITRTFETVDGKLRTTSEICRPYIDTAGVERPCEHLKVSGGAFSGWETFLSVISFGATIWSAAR